MCSSDLLSHYLILCRMRLIVVYVLLMSLFAEFKMIVKQMTAVVVLLVLVQVQIYILTIHLVRVVRFVVIMLSEETRVPFQILMSMIV